MNTPTKLKIFNDPIYGFITIQDPLIFQLIEHRYFQRLRRITQMGLSYLVFPGAHHTRFHHALGCMHLMQKAVQVLRYKGVAISEEEKQALEIAILLHDIGHGPFSHAMENSIVRDVHHEEVSLLFMHELNREFNGSLTLALQIFRGAYDRMFMNQLISSQLDMDRSDYLKRDSFYTGVAEGNINSERLISMLNVVEDQLVVEEKGIYPVEKFLTSRRFMYWQVYLHKTGLVAEQLLMRLLQRAKELTAKGVGLSASKPLQFFLKNEIDLKGFGIEVLELFSRLDDVDILAAMKSWQDHEDFVLSSLSNMLIERRLLKVKYKDKPVSDKKLSQLVERFAQEQGISSGDASYFVFTDKVINQAYNVDLQNINILMKSGKLKDVAKASDQLNIEALSKPVTKYFLCYPKEGF